MIGRVYRPCWQAWKRSSWQSTCMIFPALPGSWNILQNVKMTNTPVWFKKNWNKNVLKSAKNESCSRGTEGIHPECHTILKQNDRVPSLPTHNLLLYISHTHKYIHSHIPSVIIWRSDMTCIKSIHTTISPKNKRFRTIWGRVNYQFQVNCPFKCICSNKLNLTPLPKHSFIGEYITVWKSQWVCPDQRWASCRQL